MADFAAADIPLLAFSYDELDALEAFADEFGITFPMLSDPDSEIIDALGIRNTMVDPDDHPWYGIPFPGSYVLDADGVITAKFFENDLAFRASGRQLLDAALGRTVDIPKATTTPATVEVETSLATEAIKRGISADLYVTLRVPAGQHLYGEPVPDGMVATSVEFDDCGAILLGIEAPPTHEHTLAGTGETLHVYEGDVLLRVRFTHNGRDTTKVDGVRHKTISGRVRWQSCDDDVCHLPASQPFSFEIVSEDTVGIDFIADETPGRMHFNTHFNRMKSRRS